MISFSLIAYFVFGLIIGSFINVVVMRSGARPLSGRSGCMSCGTHIKWFDLIPVFSWLALRGRCRACGSRISAQYPAVEFFTGVLFVLVGGASLPLPAQALGLLICAVLVAITVYDFRHTVIPNAWAYAFGLIALAFSFFSMGDTATSRDIVILLLSGPAVALPLFTLWLVSGGKWIGLGDSKLALGIGWLLGPLAGIQSVLLAFIIGAVAGVGLIALSSPRWKAFLDTFTPISVSRKLALRFTMKSEVPFGPFLITACVLIWITQMYNIPLPLPFIWQ